MKFDIEYGEFKNQDKSSCIIVGVFQRNILSSIAEKINNISGNYISKIIDLNQFNGKIGKCLLLNYVPNVLSKRLLVVGFGEKNGIENNQYENIILNILKSLNQTNIKTVSLFIREIKIKGFNIYWKIRRLIEIVKEFTYNFEQFKQKKEKKFLLEKLTIHLENSKKSHYEELAIHHGLSISSGMKVAKDLSNMPPNVCNPSYILKEVTKFCKKNQDKIKLKIIDRKQMKLIGMNACLSVCQGSKNDPYIMVIKYYGNNIKETFPIIFIGKGVTFDSGGISIKPSRYMHTMKYDMCGAASVYGMLHVIMKLKLPINIIGILACCENMPDGGSFRPGDIIHTLSGKTVEIINTDAEGRLILCDLLTYVERFNPNIVVDIATLTGACAIALGKYFTGIISNCESLANKMIFSGKQANDHGWILPLEIKFEEQLQSNVADFSNVGKNEYGGAISAGYFLSQFAKKYNWIHLDIAGTAWTVQNFATGRPIPMLSQFLLNQLKD